MRLHDKKLALKYEVRVPCLMGSQTSPASGRPEIDVAGGGLLCVTALRRSAHFAWFFTAVMIVAWTFRYGPVAFGQGYSLAEALNATNLVWTSDSTDETSWFVETAVSHDGAAAVECVPRVGVYGAKLHTTVKGPGSLTFWFCFGSGPPLGTWLEVVRQKQGTVAQPVLYGGSTYWGQGGMTIGEGVYELQWGCVVKSTAEAVFLDDIQFTPSAYVTTEGLTIVNGQAQVHFSAPAELVTSFRLLSAGSLGGPWTTNTAAVLSSNAVGGSFTFTAPVSGGSAQFYRVQGVSP